MEHSSCPKEKSGAPAERQHRGVSVLRQQQVTLGIGRGTRKWAAAPCNSRANCLEQVCAQTVGHSANLLTTWAHYSKNYCFRARPQASLMLKHKEKQCD